MEQKIAYRCSQCGTLKRDTNHWWLVEAIPTPEHSDSQFVVFPWNAEDDKFSDARTCGHNCASILLARWMSTGSLDAPRKD